MGRVRLLKCILFLSIFTACVTLKNSAGNILVTGVDANIEFQVDVDNPTVFDVCIEGNQVVKAGSEKTSIVLRNQGEELTRGFDIVYAIKLSNSVTIYCRGDNQKLGRNDRVLQIKPPDIAQYYNACFIKITNRGRNAVSLYEGSRPLNTWEQTGSFIQGDHLRPATKIEFSQNETVVFNIINSMSVSDALDNYVIRDGRTSVPLKFPKVQRNYIYEFEYTIDGAALVDVRPLVKIGEPFYATIDFRSDNKISEAGRQKIIRTLTDSLKTYNVPVQIVNPDNGLLTEQITKYEFLIRAAVEKRPPVPPVTMEIVIGTIDIAFVQNGIIGIQTQQYQNRGFDTEKTAEGLSDFIPENGQFFQEVSQIIKNPF